MLLVLSTLLLVCGAAAQSLPDQYAVTDPSTTVEVVSSAGLAAAVQNQTLKLIKIGNLVLQVRQMKGGVRSESHTVSVYCRCTSPNLLKNGFMCISQASQFSSTTHYN
jgi:hypothetical protein